MHQALRFPIRTLVEGLRHWRKHGSRLRRARTLCACADGLRLHGSRAGEERAARLYRKACRILVGLFGTGPAGDEPPGKLAHMALAHAERPKRAALAAAVVLALASITVAWLGVAVASTWSIDLRARVFPRDLAAHRPWTASDAVNGYPASGVDPSSEGGAFFHTSALDRPSLEVDLGGEHVVSGFVVENRKDCCQERALPLNLEVFRDGAWHLVAQRRAPFATWTCDIPTTTATRVRALRPGQGYFHLRRLSVYGR